MSVLQHAGTPLRRLRVIRVLLLAAMLAAACAPAIRPPAPAATTAMPKGSPALTARSAEGQATTSLIPQATLAVGTPVPRPLAPSVDPSTSSPTPTLAAPTRTLASQPSPPAPTTLPPAVIPTVMPLPTVAASPVASGTAPHATAMVPSAVSFVWSPDGGSLAVAGQFGAKFLDGRSLQDRPKLIVRASSSAVALSRDGGLLASATQSNTVEIWDVTQGQLLRTLHPPAAATERPALPERIVDVAFSPDGALLSAAVKGYYAGGAGSLWSWDTANGLDRRIVPSYGAPNRLAYRPGSLVVAFGNGLSSCGRGGGGVALWDLAITQELRFLSNDGNGVMDLAISPDGTALATVGQGGASGRCMGNSVVQLWDMADGAAGRVLSDRGNATAASFSPDGALLAVAYAEGYVVLWDTVSGQPAVNLSGAGARVLRVAFNPAGQSLAALAGDGMLRLWDFPLPR